MVVIEQPVMLASAVGLRLESAEIAVEWVEPPGVLLQAEWDSAEVGSAAASVESWGVLQDTVFYWVQAVVCWMVV